jgi:hypothetical protein
MNEPQGYQEVERDISSPFSTSQTKPTEYGLRRRNGRGLIVGLSAVLLLVLGGTGVIVYSYLNDPFRKLEEFPENKYFDEFQSLAGLRFRSDLRVEADLGWKDNIGRLMVFTPVGRDRQLAVFIPPKLSSIFFNKGQHYLVEVEVKEGGLIYAEACRKN